MPSPSAPRLSPAAPGDAPNADTDGTDTTLVDGNEDAPDIGPEAATPTSPDTDSPGILRRNLGPSLKFLLVGGVVFLIDAALYNLLVFWHPWTGWGHGLLFSHPITAKVITIAFASCLTYLGNRLWTFSDRPVARTGRSLVAFVLVNLIASALQLSCLGFSRYVLGLQSPLADNISGTLIGQIVSTAFRYVTYGRFVFPRADAPTSPAPSSPSPARGRRGRMSA